MLTIGDRFPSFSVQAALPTGELGVVTDQTHAGWKVVFFWPMDFTFVCPTEIAGFGELDAQFRERGAQLLGVSIDSEYVHLAWRASHPDLRDLPFPMLADVKREISTACGVLDRQEGVSLRATFIVDPAGLIRHVSVNDLDTGRNPGEVLRTLDAMLTGKLTPCGWRPGDKTL